MQFVFQETLWLQVNKSSLTLFEIQLSHCVIFFKKRVIDYKLFGTLLALLNIYYHSTRTSEEVRIIIHIVLVYELFWNPFSYPDSMVTFDRPNL
jgi:hypothetical protein